MAESTELGCDQWACNKGAVRTALEQVYERLNTEYGAILMDPPYHAHAFDGALAVIYNAGTKENAGIFFSVTGMDHFGRSINGTWRKSIWLLYGKCSGCTE